MSQTYSNIVNVINDNLNTDDTSFTLASKTRYVNLGIDYLLLALFGVGGGGTWELDDYNQSDYPIITTSLISGQRDYSFTTDGSGNLVLDIYKVQVKISSSGQYKDIYPVSQQEANFNGDGSIVDGIAVQTMTDGNNTGGIPTSYDKTANGIFLDPIPNYNSTNGLRVFINRESTYFTSSDTTKKWGYTGLWHEYLILYTCYQYARAQDLPNREVLKRDLMELEDKIKRHLGSRQRDVKRRFIPRVENNR
jgi:hypothetical protein